MCAAVSLISEVPYVLVSEVRVADRNRSHWNFLHAVL
jgi:hypothetical protein